MQTVVLIADADPDVLAFQRQYFADHGYQAETATGSLDCLARLSRFWPDVLVLDRALPRAGADRVLTWLRKTWAAGIRPVPAVVLIDEPPAQAVSGIVITSPVVEACLQKPFLVSSLLEVVRSLTAAPWRQEARKQRSILRAGGCLESKVGECLNGPDGITATAFPWGQATQGPHRDESGQKGAR